MGIGAFSSESSSSTTTTSQSSGFSEISGVAQSLNLSTGKKSKNNTLNLLDGGAISKAFDFGAQALKQVEIAGTNNASSIRDAISAVTESSRGEGENIAITLAKWGAIAAMVYFGFRALRG